MVKALMIVFTTAGIMCVASIVRHEFVAVQGMTRAELVVVEHSSPVAVLVLAPGCNGDGGAMVADDGWQRFASENALILVGLSFASEINALHEGTGYYYAARGSGQVFLDALDRLSEKPLPVLLYGFSGGAHFTARFVEWRPKRVVAWCAYSAGWWDEPMPSDIMPPGIVACGEEDGRLGASLSYFKQGRAAGKPWLWIDVPGSGHVPDSRVEAFARDYFSAVLDGMAKGNGKTGLWVDVETKTRASEEVRRFHPTGVGWLPDARLFIKWKLLERDFRQGVKTQSFENGHTDAD